MKVSVGLEWRISGVDKFPAEWRISGVDKFPADFDSLSATKSRFFFIPCQTSSQRPQYPQELEGRQGRKQNAIDRQKLCEVCCEQLASRDISSLPLSEQALLLEVVVALDSETARGGGTTNVDESSFTLCQ